MSRSIVLPRPSSAEVPRGTMSGRNVVSGKRPSMRTRMITAAALIGAAMALGAGSASADDDGCAHFNWDISRELAVMQQSPQAIAAGKGADSTVQMQPERLYELKLAPQNTVAYA